MSVTIIIMVITFYFFFEMVLRVRLHNGRFRFYKSFTDLSVITVENVLFEDDDDTRRDTSSHDAF